jgi:adenosine deaminase
MFGCDLTSESAVCRTRCALDDVALAKIARTSLRASAAPAATVAAGLDGIDRWLEGP